MFLKKNFNLQFKVDKTMFFKYFLFKGISTNHKNEIVLITIIAFMTLVSCNKNENTELNIKNPKIKTALEKRKTEYAKEILEKCRRDILEKAEIYVDSLISAEIIFQLSDSIVFPPKPEKPNWPGPIQVPETIRATPILIHKMK
mgnify:CR=1 FL=1